MFNIGDCAQLKLILTFLTICCVFSALTTGVLVYSPDVRIDAGEGEIQRERNMSSQVDRSFVLLATMAGVLPRLEGGRLALVLVVCFGSD